MFVNIILVGQPGVGKSSMIRMLTGQQIEKNTQKIRIYSTKFSTYQITFFDTPGLGNHLIDFQKILQMINRQFKEQKLCILYLIDSNNLRVKLQALFFFGLCKIFFKNDLNIGNSIGLVFSKYDKLNDQEKQEYQTQKKNIIKIYSQQLGTKIKLFTQYNKYDKIKFSAWLKDFLTYSRPAEFTNFTQKQAYKIISQIRQRFTKSKGCFSLTGKVNIKGGQKQIKDLQIGDKVLSWDFSKNKLIQDEVVAFIHKKKDTQSQFICLILNNGQSIKVTPNHLLYCSDKKLRAAGDFLVGQYLLGADYELKKIVTIKHLRQIGFCAPLTSTGTIIYQGCVMS